MKPYPRYKDSGVEWIGEVPEGWEVKKLKYLASLITTKAQENNNKIALENIKSQTGKFFETETIFEGEGVSFIEGDLLYGKLRPYLANLKFSYPSIPEQTAIANYLDRKTAEIDSLVAKKQRLIELYEEEKTAVINQAVTKGLGPFCR